MKIEPLKDRVVESLKRRVVVPFKRLVRRTRSDLKPHPVAVLALAVVFLAAWLSHEWDPDAGLNVAYVVLALVVLALAFPFTRRFLDEATHVKLPGGVEITRQLGDAAETIKGLPVVDKDEKADENEGENEDKGPKDRPLKVISDDWQEDPTKALSDLRVKLKQQIAWLREELYPPPERPGTDRAVLKQLEKHHLISAQEARISNAVMGISGRVIARGYDSDSEEVQKRVIAFMKGADGILNQLRLIALDKRVRKALTDKQFKILDYENQPKGRWPDFYAFHPEHRDKPLRIAVRMARTRNSDVVREARDRMRRKGKIVETPLDDQVQRVIVVPATSQTPQRNLDDDRDAKISIPAVKRDKLDEWIDRHLSGEQG